MEELKLFYESQGINNYLCIKVLEPLSKYQVKMLECNKIPGLLPVHGTVMNGVYKLHYDITKMQRLSDVLKSGIHGQRAKKLLLDILEVLLGAEDYFLSFTRCLLNPDYMFTGQDDKIGMVYLPYQEKEVTSADTIRLFYQTLLAEYLAEDNDVFFLMLLKYVNKHEFSIAGLLEKLKEGCPGSATKEPVYVKPTEQPAEKPEDQYTNVESETPEKKAFIGFIAKKEKAEEKKEIQKEKEKTPDLSSLELGFQVPGMKNVPADAGQESKKEEKEKKGSLFSGLFANGKKTQESVHQKQEAGTGVPAVKQPGKQEELPQRSAGGWSGTVMLSKENVHTEMIHGQRIPRLLHNGTIVLLEKFPFRIGNGKIEGMDYIIPKKVISKNHASIQYSRESYYIKDENSANHTYLNGRQIPPYTEVALEDGALIRLADEEMTFQL